MKYLLISVLFIAGCIGGLNEPCNRDGSCNSPRLTCAQVSPSVWMRAQYLCVLK